MKKLTILTFALFLSSAMVLAQNSTEVEQIGNDNDVTVSQIGDNEATIYQGIQKYASAPAASAENNKATVTQDGTFEAFIIQGDAGTAKNSESTIIQNGISGYAAILQGVFNGGTAISTTALVEQNQEGNTGQIRQGLAGSTEGGSATVKQTGAENTGIIYQGVQKQSLSLNNVGNITQNGANNSSTTILQGSKLSPAASGSGKGIAADNSATILQNGNANGSNGVRIFQGLNGGTAINNSGLIKQNGNINNAKINQGVGDNASVSDSDASIYQFSDNNNATITQNGVNHSAIITQN